MVPSSECGQFERIIGLKFLLLKRIASNAAEPDAVNDLSERGQLEQLRLHLWQVLQDARPALERIASSEKANPRDVRAARKALRRIDGFMTSDNRHYLKSQKAVLQVKK